jgi:2-polyprenyl-3-methyl-5-hydroxy-6-metoxy-1,4-benzoquinol methylase
MKQGWFRIPGEVDGPRTLKEQMLGLGPALAEANGKTVCDLGTAEGLIALEFAKAGAASIYGCDYNAEMVDTARSLSTGIWNVCFEHKDITELLSEPGPRWQYDIVLALAVLHKLADPRDGVRFCCAVARSLIVVRLPIKSTGRFKSKHSAHKGCDLSVEMPRHGFRRERKEAGPRGEWVHYYRKC